MNVYLFPVAAAALAEGRATMADLLGEIPDWTVEADPRDAVTQLDSHYGHGGGWHDSPRGVKLVDADNVNARLLYPGDPPYRAVARWQLRDERIILFASAYVAVVQPDGTFRTCRMD
jgi:hypothetical protein